MERLTEKSIGAFAYRLKNHKAEVGEFNTYDAFYDYSMALKRLGEFEDAEEQGRLVVLPEPTPDIDFMRIFNLVMADTEDRVIVLPCKVGDAIFLVERGNILKEKVLGFIEAGCGLIMNVTYRDYVAKLKCENIGKLLDDEHLSVFLSREEAEKALDGMK